MHSVIRLLGFGLTLLLFYNTSSELFYRVTSSYSMSHYVMAILLSPLFVSEFPKSFAKNPLFAYKILAVIGLAVLASILKTPAIVMLFGVHFAFSDVYLKAFNLNFWVNGSRLILNFIIYFGACTTTVFSFKTYLFGLLFGSILFLAIVFKNKDKFSKANFLDLILFELIGVAAGIMLYRENAFTAFVMYHLIIWYLLPFLIARKLKLSQILFQFSLGTAFYFVMWGISSNFSDAIDAVNWIVIGGFFHIVLSFFVAKNNPEFILRFQQKWIFRKA
jgi:hypothetical protein